MRVRGARHRAPVRMTTGARLAQAACPLGGSYAVDPSGQDRRAYAIERRAVVWVQCIDLLPDAKPASAVTAAARPPGREAEAANAASRSRASTSTTAPARSRCATPENACAE